MRTAAVSPWEILSLVKENIAVEEENRRADVRILGDEHPSIIRRDGRIEMLKSLERQIEEVLA